MTRRTARRVGWNWLAVPAVAFLGVAFFWPLLDMLHISLTDPGPENYRFFGKSPIFLRSYLTTFRIAVIVTVLCLVIGYPYAYVMNRAKGHTAMVLTFFVLLPFWSSILVRTYAWTVWLQDTGVINSALRSAGLTTEPVQLVRNDIGTVIGMVHVLLPIMVLTLYAGMRRVDVTLVPAAHILGARPFAAFRKVFLPLTVPAVFSGCVLVFVISLGFYLTPAILGDPADVMVSQLIVEQTTRLLNFGVGSALGMVLLGATLVVLALGSRVVSLDPTGRSKS
ncbi:ABC transporter permease [Actinomadura coerulea]|uniref:ABC transporter permease n=1 Tax=Actinomadura coerulea TaxID=46159 RepID=UPI00342C8310